MRYVMNNEKENDIQKMIQEENKVKEIIRKRMLALGSYDESDAEILSYRLAEILINAKNLYTDDFPDLLQADMNDSEKVWNSLMGMRMTLLHIRDCIEEYDMMLLELLKDREKEEDEDGEEDEE